MLFHGSIFFFLLFGPIKGRPFDGSRTTRIYGTQIKKTNFMVRRKTHNRRQMSERNLPLCRGDEIKTIEN
jgi:hypothetical protein